MAIRRIVDDLFAAQRALAQSLLSGMAKGAAPADASRALLHWAEKNEAALDRTKSFLAGLESAGDFSIAKLTLATSQIHKLSEI
jgi:glutamate dehydrogenase